MKKAFVIIWAVLALIVIGPPAHAASSYQRSVTVQTDYIPTDLTFTVQKANDGYRSSVSCVTVKTYGGYDRIITIKIYQGGTYASTPVKNYRQRAQRIVYCIQKKQFSIGHMRQKPYAHITVSEDVPGPWTPDGRAILRLF